MESKLDSSREGAPWEGVRQAFGNVGDGSPALIVDAHSHDCNPMRPERRSQTTLLHPSDQPGDARNRIADRSGGAVRFPTPPRPL